MHVIIEVKESLRGATHHGGVEPVDELGSPQYLPWVRSVGEVSDQLPNPILVSAQVGLPAPALTLLDLENVVGRGARRAETVDVVEDGSRQFVCPLGRRTERDGDAVALFGKP